MISGSSDVMDAIAFFKGAFMIVMALAVAEAFKQFVTARTAGEAERRVGWERALALVSFIFLIVPFYQGMSRYFFLTYGDSTKLPQPYAAFLLFDAVNFLIESMLFFAMSQALAITSWRRFHACVLTLLSVDIVWVWLSTWLHGGTVAAWMLINVVCAIVLLAIVRWPKSASRQPALWAMIAVMARTIADYGLLWNFYFP
jgi:hypothetical protein